MNTTLHVPPSKVFSVLRSDAFLLCLYIFKCLINLKFTLTDDIGQTSNFICYKCLANSPNTIIYLFPTLAKMSPVIH
jgi:hypothetical protein